MASEHTELSRHAEVPTVFTYSNTLKLPKGERVLNPANWQYTELPANMACTVAARAYGSYHDGIFSGAFETNANYKAVELTGVGFEASMSGKFEVYLA